MKKEPKYTNLLILALFVLLICFLGYGIGKAFDKGFERRYCPSATAQEKIDWQCPLEGDK